MGQNLKRNPQCYDWFLENMFCDQIVVIEDLYCEKDNWPCGCGAAILDRMLVIDYKCLRYGPFAQLPGMKDIRIKNEIL